MTVLRKKIQYNRQKTLLPSVNIPLVRINNDDINHSVSSSNNNKIPILKKLSSLNVDDRAWTASAISHLATENHHIRQLLLSNNVVGELSKALADPNPDVAVEIIGALRNLILEDECSLIEEMKKQNVFDLLLSHLNKIVQILGPSQQVSRSLPKEQITTWYRLTEQYLLLLLSFLEASVTYMDFIVSSPTILQFMLLSSSPNRNIPIPVIIASLQCLNLLTDDSSSLSSLLYQNHPDFITSLIDIAHHGAFGYNVFDDDNRMLVRVLAANLVSNVTAANNSKPQAWANSVLPAVMFALSSFDLVAALGKASGLDQMLEVDVVSNMVNNDATMNEKDGGNYEDERLTSGKIFRVQRAISILESHFMTMQFALELLANTLTDDETQSLNWQNIDDTDVAMINNEELTKIDHSSVLNDQITTETAAILITLLLPICQIGSSLNMTTPVCLASSINGARIRALSCLEALLMSVDRSWYNAKGSQEIIAMWSWLVDIANLASASGDLESLESCIGSMLALCTGLRVVFNINIGYTEELLDALISLCKNSSNPPILIIKSIHLMASLASISNRIPSNHKVGLLLLDLIGVSSQPEIIFEALDVIFDVYSDASYDYDRPVFVEMGFLQRLKELVERIKMKVRNLDKNKESALYARGREVLGNLVEFIKYKENERVISG